MSVKAFHATHRVRLQSPTDKWVLFMLPYYADENREASPTIKELVFDTQMSRTTIKDALARLEADGWITRKARFREDGSKDSNLYRLTFMGGSR